MKAAVWNIVDYNILKPRRVTWQFKDFNINRLDADHFIFRHGCRIRIRIGSIGFLG